EIEVRELAELVGNSGHAIVPGHMVGGMKSENCTEMELFALDFDDGASFEEVKCKCNQIGLPITFAYHTYSSSETAERFRVVFVHECLIRDLFVIRVGLGMLYKIFPDCDRACKNPDRLFLGVYELAKNTTFFLLRSYAVNYPVIREKGCDLPKAILLIVGEGKGRVALDLLVSDLDIRIDEQMRASQMVALMSDVNSGFIVYYAVASRKSIDFLENLGIMARTGRFFGAELTAPILVVAEGIPTGADLSSFFLVFHESPIRDVPVQMEDVIPLDNALPVVFDKMQKHCRGSVELQAWTAAACFMYTQLQEEERRSLFRFLLNSARTMVREDENNQGEELLGELVVDAFYSWQTQTVFCNIIELPDIDKCVRFHENEYIFFDDQYIYLTSSLFKDITKQLLYTFAITRLKCALREEGILCSDHSDTYTAKMRYYDVKSDCHRSKRMLRLRRDRLNRVGDMDFVELCLETRKEEYDD
ncbi:MAG: hypothetical protein LIO80_09675, partial [Lachnospiraceae bacterium]|nr:hypothetical protein [Lachnospiraceae bacterium]